MDNPKELGCGVTRRQLFGSAAVAVATTRPALARSATPYVDIMRAPDLVTASLETQTVTLTREGGRWIAQGIAVEASPSGGRIPVRIEAPEAPLMRIRLRWHTAVPSNWRIVNDHWERSYGDLEWRGMADGRVLPWYFLASDGRRTHGYGVATGASAMCFWQVDPAGISLWLDVRNGGGAVHLGNRVLEAAVIHSRAGSTGESPYEAARSFCRVLCLKPRLPDKPVYGGNNWYYAYGENCSATALIHDAELIAELSPTGGVRPFMVMDDGWGTSKTTGPWDHGNDRFPDMADLAAGVRKLGVRPGIWFRPLYTAAPVPELWRLRPGSPAGREGRRVTLDPSIPEVVEAVRADVRRLTGWGYEMLKHDFTSYDVLARWGPTMGAVLTDRGWHFSDRSRTTAEIVLALYRAIREAAGDALVIGCNTFGHLGAGLFELQRTGDDVSGRDFHRTRLMGVNTLAFRGPQHGTFFAVDADCVPVTPMVDWSKNRLWLDLVAESRTALFVSADPRATGPEQKAALRQAFARASSAGPAAEPLDWTDTTTPGRWRIDGRTKEYDWYGAEGSSPFAR